ncbi:hypothetical protein PV325_007027 [Microctonus aethiopoides]|uniref:Uncharacterized protein n=1 Tax=Microctonus aethiopoides TaxID=144406 RepID=A0AA39FBD1_9HYME|nr:hypothetical protein PV325_007027 [Microctonus aethiopoides]KAK0166279.1 hypothetical protein PV328_004713 [Microctonus aethiopoides]
MWPLIMKICTLKLLWIFLFVIISTTTFLMIVYKGQKSELKKYILDGDNIEDDLRPVEICNSVHSQLQSLAENLLEKDEQLKKSRSDLKCAEKVLDFIENNKISSVTRYKQLLSGLKDDLEKIEYEVKELQTEITGLSKQREHLKTDILQQQEGYQKLFHAFAREFNIVNDSILSNPFSNLKIGGNHSMNYYKSQ